MSAESTSDTIAVKSPCLKSMISARLLFFISSLTKSIYAVIYPRDVWWTKLALLFMNFYPIITGSSFRVFIHPTKKVEEIIIRNGLKRDYYATTLFWQVATFTK